MNRVHGGEGRYGRADSQETVCPLARELKRFASLGNGDRPKGTALK